MSELTIWPVKMGVFRDGDKSANIMGYVGMKQGGKMDVPIILFVIKGAQKNIIVDTGACDPAWAEKYHHQKLDEYLDVTAALAGTGLHPDDIDVVVATHLHWDHCFNNDQFKNARVIVQKDEIHYAMSPLPLHALGYESQLIGMRPSWLRALERTEVIDGDMELVPGVSLVKIPSHTPGIQGVNVKTEKGNYFIASDFCPLFENWEGTPMVKHLPSPIHVNLEDYFNSFAKVEKFADFVLPGHDMKVFDKTCYP